MREFGWTERQLREEVTLGMLEKIATVLELEGKKAEIDSRTRTALPSTQVPRRFR